MSDKEIYSFSTEVKQTKEISETKTEVNKETGKSEKFTVSKTVEVPTRYRIIIKQPNRRQMEEADMEYSIEMSRCIKKGILTKAMLSKKYSDLGGMMTEDDALELNKHYARVGELQTDYQRLQSKENKSADDLSLIRQVLVDLTETRTSIVNLETAYSSLFNHTADTKAQNKVIMWYVVNLTYFKEEESEEAPKALFEGVSADEKLEQYYVFDEQGKSEIFNNIKNKLTTFVSYWFFSSSTDKTEFDNLNEDVEEVTEELEEESNAREILEESSTAKPKATTRKASRATKKTTKKT
jgi:hypothetical protein